MKKVSKSSQISFEKIFRYGHILSTEYIIIRLTIGNLQHNKDRIYF